MLRKPAHFIFYLSTLQKPAAGAGFCNVLKYKDDTFYLSTIQKPAPECARGGVSHILAEKGLLASLYSKKFMKMQYFHQ